MSNYVRNLSFVAEGPDYCLMADDKGQLIRVEGLFEAEKAELAGRPVRERSTPYQALLTRIAQLT